MPPSEEVIQEVMRAFHCTRDQVAAFAAYCAATEQEALQEAADERAQPSTASLATADADSRPAAGTPAIVLRGKKLSVVLTPDGVIREMLSSELSPLQSV
jgi:hypothetical protein